MKVSGYGADGEQLKQIAELAEAGAGDGKQRKKFA